MRRVTVNLTDEGDAALHRLPGRDHTAALNRALRVADAVQRYAVDGVLTILDEDGELIRVHLVA